MGQADRRWRPAAIAIGMVIGCLTAATAAWAQAALAEGDLVQARRPSSDYVVGPKDVVSIAVWNQPTLSGRFTIDADGTLAFPLVGRVRAGGLTVRGLEGLLTERLADGFLAKPEVRVAIEDYRSQRVFVVGEVRQPGPIPLTGRTTLIEVLALARSTTAEAAKEAVIVRAPPGTTPNQAVLPTEANPSQVIRVDLNALQTGSLADNTVLHDGDTVFIPRAPTVVVFGQVRNPGVYPIGRNTTVVEVLALAGGVADRGAANRTRILRTVDGKKKEWKVKLNDVVQPGDTLIVPERLF